MLIYEAIEELSHKDKLRIIKDFEEFKEKGVIGTCFLRSFASDLNKRLQFSYGIVALMETVAFATYRNIALSVLNEYHRFNGDDSEESFHKRLEEDLRPISKEAP